MFECSLYVEGVCFTYLLYWVFNRYCFFRRILKSLPPLPRQHWAAIGRSKNCQSKGLTVHSNRVEKMKTSLAAIFRRGIWMKKKKTRVYLDTLAANPLCTAACSSRVYLDTLAANPLYTAAC